MSVSISIITISYNQARFIRKAIESVVGQNYPNLEYIVIDAGSTDGSRDIIDAFESQIQQKVYEPDKGQADGLNKGLDRATGEIVGFVNSDDLLLPGALEFVGEFFDKNPNADVLMGTGYKVDEKLQMIHEIIPDHFSSERYAQMCFNFIQTSTFFRRSKVVELGGFNLANRTCWDGELIADLGISGAVFRRTMKALSAFRIYDGSISGSGTNQDVYLADRQRIFEKIMGRKPATKDGFMKLLLRGLNLAHTPRKLLIYYQKRRPAAWRKPIG